MAEAPEKILVISASGLSIEVDPDGEPSVLIHLEIPDNQLGLAPGVSLALRMTAAQTRILAAALDRKADEAEAGLPRA